MTGLKRAIFLTCDAPRTLSQIKENVSAVSGEIHSSEDFKLELQDLLRGRIFIEGNGRFLNLAVAVNEEERDRLLGKQIAVNASSTERSDSTIYL